MVPDIRLVHPARTDAVKPAPSAAPKAPPPKAPPPKAPDAIFAPSRTRPPEPLSRGAGQPRAGTPDRAPPPRSMLRRLTGCVVLLGVLGCGGGVLGGGAIGLWSVLDPNGFNSVVKQINDAVAPYLGGGTTPSKQPTTPTPRRRSR